MAYVNVGVNAPYCATKKALREAVKGDPARVLVYGTSVFGPQFGGAVSDLPEGTSLSVVGPDPYNNRRWYATIERRNGRIVVS